MKNRLVSMTQVLFKTFIAVFLLLGMVVSQVYVVGFEHHRFFAPSWFYLSAAIIIPFTKPALVSRQGILIYSMLMLVTLYLGLRGVFAELPILAAKEFPVFFYGLVVFMGIAALGKDRRTFMLVWVVVCGLYLYQITVALLPEELALSMPRAWGRVVGQRGCPGLFRHYNPFASYCGLSMAVISGLFMLKLDNKKAQTIARAVLAVMSILTFMAAYQSGSRLGTAVVIFTAVLAVSLTGLINFTFQEGRLRSRDQLVKSLFVLIFTLGASIFVANFTFNLVSESRGRTGSLQEDTEDGMRVATMELGSRLWLENPLLGNGPRAFWVHAPRLRGEGNVLVNRIGDPEMVHNDYLQTLAEYGIVGLLLILATVVVVLYSIWKISYLQRFINYNWYIAPIISTSATIGVMLHSLADFTMHITPVFCLWAMIVGGSYGYSTRLHVTTRKTPKSTFLYSIIFRSGAMWAGVILFLVIGGKHVLYNIDLIKYDYAKWNLSSKEYLEVSRKVSQLAPDPVMLEEMGRKMAASALSATSESHRRDLLRDSERAYLEALELQPYRINTVVNLIVVKMKLGDLEKVESLMAKAFELSGRRWRVHELDRLALVYLCKIGENYWFEERDASKARAYFQEAQKYLGYNRIAGGRDLRAYKAPYRNKVEEYLTVMEAGKIEAATDITFFEGKGL